MKHPKQVLINVGDILILAILVLVPFQAFLSVWLSSIFGHYTTFRLVDEIALLLCSLIAIYLLIADSKLCKQIFSSKLTLLIVAYGVVQIIWGIVAYSNHDVNKKALAYGFLINTRFLVFFIITWIFTIKSKQLKKPIYKVILWPATIVILFGLLQIFVLPRDFLSHFGYGPSTIQAFETINHNSKYLRIESTLRGANPLGAYLIIPLSLISALLLKGKRNLKRVAFLIAGLVVLVFSFSRGALAGFVLSFAVVAFYSVKSTELRRKLAYLCIAAVIILVGLGIALRNNARVQNLVWHTQTNSASKISSDQAHSSALFIGAKQVVHRPLGSGPGTAGPASVYNNHPARIAENYYVQVGQETGWLGLAIFISINAYIGYLLWLRRSGTLELALLASLIGISFVNLLSHAWTDDTLSYIWWGIAGIALANKPKKTAKSDV